MVSSQPAGTRGANAGQERDERHRTSRVVGGTLPTAPDRRATEVSLDALSCNKSLLKKSIILNIQSRVKQRRSLDRGAADVISMP